MSKYGKPFPTNQAQVVDAVRPGIAISSATGDDYGTLGAIINRDLNINLPGFLTNEHVVKQGDVYHPAFFRGLNKLAKVIGKVDRASSQFDAVSVKFELNANFTLELQVDTDTKGIQKFKHDKIVAPKVGMWVEKVGATTGYTVGYIDSISDTAISVSHAPAKLTQEFKSLLKEAGFKVEEIPSPPPLCAGGDSGSVWCVYGTHAPVALHKKSSTAGADQIASATRLDFLRKEFEFSIRT